MAKTLFRKVIRLPGSTSPNVRLALEEIKAGKEPSNTVVVPGMLTFEEFCHREATWDPARKAAGLYAEFYKGAELLLYPPDWLDRAEKLALLRTKGRAQGQTWMGVDPAEGGDKSAWTVIDRGGIVKQVSFKTPDTNVVPYKTIELLKAHDVKPEDVAFDRGGGKTHADRLRAMGYHVRTVAFGNAMQVEPKRGLTMFEVRREAFEERGEYKTRVAQMYWELAELLDPVRDGPGFAIPGEYAELRRQMAVIPKWTDEFGKRYIPQKHRKPDQKDEANPHKPTLVDLIGHSPDELDSLVVACHAMLHKKVRATAGVR